MLETVYVRLRLGLLAFAALSVLIGIPFVRVDVGRSTVTYFHKLSDQITQRTDTFAPARGRIYDRWGELLATNDVEYELGITPPYVISVKDLSTTINQVAGIPTLEVEAAIKSSKQYVL